MSIVPLDLLALQMRHHRLDREVSHLDRILHDQPVDVRRRAAPSRDCRGVEADEPDLARPAVLLEHAHHRERGRFVRAEDAVHARLPSGVFRLLRIDSAFLYAPSTSAPPY